MKSPFFIAMLFFLIVGCSTQQGQTTLILESKSPQEIEYSVNRIQFNIFSDTIRIDHNKLFPKELNIIDIPLSTPSFVQTEFNDSFYTLFLEPGNKLQITVTDSSAIFSGEGANTNNYLMQTGEFWKRCHTNVGQYISKPPKEYGYFLDSVSTALATFNNNYLEKNSIKNETWQILKVKNETDLIVLKSIYKFVNPTVFNSLDSIPNKLLYVYKNLPFDKKYLEMGMSGYFNALDLYNRFEVISSLTINTNENDSIIAQIPIVAYNKIKGTDSIKAVQELLLAKYISYWLSEKGITPAIDSIYYDYKSEYANSKYLTVLGKQYEEFYALTLGQPAPEITGVNIKGDTITLSSLKGKIVYVDVWATWCGPCLAEFPFYTSIQDNFKENKEVVFLFVSKDSDKDKWKNYVENEMGITGIQLLELENETHPSLSESYKLWGIPHYILIDKNGKIVINKAPRPSSGKVIKEIEKLL